jgi:hypothetical protein
MLMAAAIALLSLPIVPFSPCVAVGQAPSGTVPCLETSITLEELIECIDPYMPASFSQDGRDGFDVPTETEMAQWRDVVTQMMENDCDTIDLSGYEWGSDFRVITFVDNSTPYCVFVETRFETYWFGDRVTHGWGTFIVNPDSVRQLNISAPHPISDMDTNDEAIGIFKSTQSRTFLVSGGHRQASDVVSSCQNNYMRSDAAHNTEGMFQATVVALKGYYDSQGSEFYHLQFHGMSTCCTPCDLHMSHGSGAPPTTGDKVLELRDNLLRYHPEWRICLSGDIGCSLNGLENVQGRLLNGVSDDRLCSDPAPNYSGHFVHIEQCRTFRKPSDWSQAIMDTWPVHSYYLPIIAHGFVTVVLGQTVQGPGEP